MTDTAAAAEASHMGGKITEAAKQAVQNVQGATSLVTALHNTVTAAYCTTDMQM